MTVFIMYALGMSQWAGHMPMWYMVLGIIVGVIELSIWSAVVDNK